MSFNVRKEFTKTYLKCENMNLVILTLKINDINYINYIT